MGNSKYKHKFLEDEDLDFLKDSRSLVKAVRDVDPSVVIYSVSSSSKSKNKTECSLMVKHNGEEKLIPFCDTVEEVLEQLYGPSTPDNSQMESWLRDLKTNKLGDLAESLGMYTKKAKDDDMVEYIMDQSVLSVLEAAARLGLLGTTSLN